MRVRFPGKWEIGGIAGLASAFIAGVGPTLRLTVENAEGPNERIRRGDGQILITWHGRTWIPLYYFRGKSLVTMISPSRDGDIQNRIFERFGWKTVRGSSGRGAARATLESVRKLQAGATLALSPDGPKGPTRVVQPGTLYLAKKAGCPVVPVGVSCSPAWRLGSWDRFMIPKPFGRAMMMFGEPVVIPQDASDEELRDLAVRLGEMIDDLERSADAAVGSKDVALARI